MVSSEYTYSNKIFTKKNIISGLIIFPIKTAFATCAFEQFAIYPNTPNTYVQNGSITCTGEFQPTTIRADSSGYGGNIFVRNYISAETSQVLRWSNPINSNSGNIEINISPWASINGSGTTKGLLLVHNGYYRTDGNGSVPALNARFFDPENRVKIYITNNGSVRYTATTPNTDTNTASAVSIESNDGPADQYVINNGNIYSSSAYGVLMSGLAVYGFSSTYLPLVDYKYTYNNIIGVTNNGDITQDLGVVDPSSKYAGHSAGVTLITPSAKEVFLINNEKARIKGMKNGVDILTSDYVQSSFIKNSGEITGVEESGISLTPGAISTEMAYTPSIDFIHNTQKGIITGGKNGILNQGKIEIIDNYGKISAPTSINNESGEILQSINNYGVLEGDVLLGKSTINIKKSSNAISTSPEVIGMIKGDHDSIINIGAPSESTDFLTGGSASVDSIHISSKSNLKIKNSHVWEAFGKGFTNNGTLSLAAENPIAEVRGNFNNAGIIDISSSTSNQALTIAGNYQGNQGVVRLHTHWKDNGSPNGLSQSDQLIISGDVSGTTQVSSFYAGQEGISGDIQSGNHVSSPVIQVKGSVNSSNFYGYASTVNAEEAQLVMNPDIDPSTGFKTFSWKMESEQGPIYSPDVPGYVSVAYANIEMMRDSIATYHDRKGIENPFTSDLLKNKNFWGKFFHKNLKGSGQQRLDWKSNMTGYQIGYELDNTNSQEKSTTTNIYASYILGNSKSYDRLRSESARIITSKYTGDMKTHNFNLGISRTYLDEINDSYTDVVLQASAVHNKYSSIRNRIASNNGWGLTASFEQGKTYYLDSKFSIEPMYQLIANYFSLKDFNDGVRNISQGSHWDGLLRLGGRIYYNKHKTQKQENVFYMKSYFNYDFKSNGKAQVGQSYITDKNANRWGEIGLGFQRNHSKNTYYFIDASIEKNLGGAYRKTHAINVGINHRW